METKKVLITSEENLMKAIVKARVLTETTVSVYDGKRVQFNTSGINEILIKTAAKICEHYCSDVVYDINDIQEIVDNFKCGKAIHTMGFYNCGIHSNNNVVISEKEYDKVLVFYIEQSKESKEKYNIGLKEIKKGVY